MCAYGALDGLNIKQVFVLRDVVRVDEDVVRVDEDVVRVDEDVVRVDEDVVQVMMAMTLIISVKMSLINS